MSETKQEEDIYVDATEEITGQDMKLSVQGDTSCDRRRKQ